MRTAREAISWHLCEVLGLDEKTNRIVFHEIHKQAILDAIKNPPSGHEPGECPAGLVYSTDW